MTEGSAACVEGFRVVLAGPVFHQPLRQLSGLPSGCPPPGHDGMLVWQLARDLAARGQDVVVVTLDREASGTTWLKGSDLSVAIGPYRPQHRMRDIMRVEREAVCHAVRSATPDLVHAHWCYEYALGALAANVPVLVTVHDWIPAVLRHTSLRYYPYWLGRAAMYAAVLARARHFTAVSPYAAKRVRALTRSAVEVVPNGVGDDHFRDPSRYLAPGHLAASRYFLSANNGFSPRKNVKALLRAYAIFRERRTDCALVLAGEGYEASGPCAAWAQQRGLHVGVEFAGSLQRRELMARMRDALALVHPAREENMPMTIVEAMSQGLPVIGGRRAGGVPWVLANGAAGLLVNVRDPRDIAAAMQRLADDPSERQHFARAAYDRAWCHFRQSRVTDQYASAYRRVLEEERRARPPRQRARRSPPAPQQD